MNIVWSQLVKIIYVFVSHISILLPVELIFVIILFLLSW